MNRGAIKIRQKTAIDKVLDMSPMVIYINFATPKVYI